MGVGVYERRRVEGREGEREGEREGGGRVGGCGVECNNGLYDRVCKVR